MIDPHSYVTLGNQLYTVIAPRDSMETTWVYFNHDVAKAFHITDLYSDTGKELLTGTKQDHTYFAQSYAGHQFGHFTILGDGRALNVGEIHHNNTSYDIQLKGSGPTPYSRGGDGLATLYSMLREYVISESLHYMNIPSSRTLAIITTGQQVPRKVIHKGAIATRIASSHIRVGTFEYAKQVGGIKLVQELADYTIKQHYPDSKNDYYKLFHNVLKAQAKLVALWQSVGFIHGVLNTDNVLLSGESIDFGPCAFMDIYDPNTVYSSIDHFGRYKYSNQPSITSWNLSKLAEVIYPLLDSNKEKAIQKANNLLRTFEDVYYYHYYDIMRKKLGLSTPNRNCINQFLDILKRHKLDYTNTFVSLTKDKIESLLELDDFATWYQDYKQQRHKSYKDLMTQHNPVLIPRNHIVEKALNDAAFDNDFKLLETLLDHIKDPFNYNKNIEDKFKQPNPNDKDFVTYCGT